MIMSITASSSLRNQRRTAARCYRAQLHRCRLPRCAPWRWRHDARNIVLCLPFGAFTALCCCFRATRAPRNRAAVHRIGKNETGGGMIIRSKEHEQ
jgi:hypothetical protein